MKHIAVLALILLSFAAAPSLAAEQAKGIGNNGPTKMSQQTESQLSHTIADFHHLGVKWLRMDFDWRQLEPAKGIYRTEDMDRVVRAMRQADINVLGVIAYSPQWASHNDSKFVPPDHPDDFAEFARFLASRYGPMGVHAWEIWNEPNIGQFWAPAPDPKAYASILRRAYQAIHQADPAATVLTGGLAQPRTTATTTNAIDFLKGIYENGAAPYFDGVADHPYSSPKLPSDSSSNWQKIVTGRESLYSIMVARGDGGKPVWITEYGAPTSGISAYSQKVVIDEERQAVMLEDAYSRLASMTNVGPLFWYQYQDLCPPNPKLSSECFYGIIRFDGSPKPAYEKYRAAMNSPQ